MKIKIYVISLEKATERRVKIEQQLKKLDYEYEIINAIDGILLSEDELTQKVDPIAIRDYPKWLTRGAIGCALSHYIAFEKIIEDNVDYGIILEDDAQLASKFQVVIDELINKSLLDNDTVTLLYTQSNSTNLEFSTINEQNIIDNFTLNYPVDIKYATTALGYIVSNKIAVKFKKLLFPIHAASDTWDYFLREDIFKKINCVLPFVATPYGFESTIGYIDHECGIKMKMKNFLRKFFPNIVRIIVRQNTKIYLMNAMKYKKVDKNHLFMQ